MRLCINNKYNVTNKIYIKSRIGSVKCCYLFVIYIRVKHERSKYLSMKRDLTDF